MSDKKTNSKYLRQSVVSTKPQWLHLQLEYGQYLQSKLRESVGIHELSKAFHSV